MRKSIAALFTLAGATLLTVALLLARPQQLSAQKVSHPEGQQPMPLNIMLTNTLFFPIISNQQNIFQLSGGPLYRTDAISDVWYLLADRQILADATVVDPFPFDPELDANSLAAKDGQLFALAQDGLYQRADENSPWEQLNNIDGYFLSAGMGELWYTPLDCPDQVWTSLDGNSWEAKSDGLGGVVISPVLIDPISTPVTSW